MTSEKQIVEKRIGRRKRVKHALPFEERLLEAARKARDSAGKLPPGSERESLLRLAHETESAAQMSRLMASPKMTLVKQ